MGVPQGPSLGNTLLFLAKEPSIHDTNKWEQASIAINVCLRYSFASFLAYDVSYQGKTASRHWKVRYSPSSKSTLRVP